MLPTHAVRMQWTPVTKVPIIFMAPLFFFGRPRRSCLRSSAVACASEWLRLRVYAHFRPLHPEFCLTRAFVATMSSILRVALRVYVHGRLPSAISARCSMRHVVAASIHASCPSASPSCVILADASRYPSLPALHSLCAVLAVHPLHSATLLSQPGLA
ncbi:hypothetical protein B0H19DRAFT_1250635 [Mycena capillaripes]|nr:hypothetical protein B0H19DRAFT_1250635 [Mycena capillaripes]